MVVVLRKSDLGILERETRGSNSTYLSSVNPLVARVPAIGVIHSYPTWLFFWLLWWWLRSVCPTVFGVGLVSGDPEHRGVFDPVGVSGGAGDLAVYRGNGL